MAHTNVRRVDDLQALLRIPGIVPPKLAVINHDSPAEEKFTRNGIVRTAHVVVKNTPFNVQLQMQNNMFHGQLVDFHCFTMDVVLVYDTDPGVREKEVDYVKIKPVQFKCTINDRADQATVELKVKVLTSQHEDLYFRAKIVTLDPRTGKEFSPSVFAYTEPIKIISKPEQLKKRKSAKKRTLTDILVETVTRIEKQQDNQAKLIEKLLDGAQRGFPNVIPSTNSPHNQVLNNTNSNTSTKDTSFLWENALGKATDSSSSPSPPAASAKGSSVMTEVSPDFEVAFATFIAAYNSLASEERPEKIRRIIRTSSTRDTERLSELIDLFTAEGLQQGVGSEISIGAGGTSCQCTHCPHRLELLKIDDFYKEFLSSPLLDGGVSVNMNHSLTL